MSFLQFKGITKVYPGVTALKDVSFSMHEGEVHALMGENGAGKSTLIKMVAGAITPSEGLMIIGGKAYSGLSPKQASDLGISVIYQEFNLIPYLTVVENIFFGQEIRTWGPFMSRATMRKAAVEIIRQLGLDIDPDERIQNLTVAYQQMVEIAKALVQQCKILIMDEPTAPLSRNEVEKLFNVVRLLKSKGVLVIYVSHRMEEIFEISDSITVLRDGTHIMTTSSQSTNRAELIRWMVGRELSEAYPPASERKLGNTILKARDITNAHIRNINFDLAEGEILGLFGLIGSGRTELARALFGADPIWQGTITLRDHKAEIRSPQQAILQGIGLIPEDRKQQGLLLGMTVRENTTFSSLPAISNNAFIDKQKEQFLVSEYISRLRIRTPDAEQLVKNLSGGNQQKIVLAKWLSTACNILILDEPTRGIDVGAKQEIYQLMRELSSRGVAILMISSEMPELMGMADRIMVLRGGEIVGECKPDEYNQETLMSLASY
jgi:ribose transport system ATP-binding protein